MAEAQTRGTWISLSHALAQRLQAQLRDGTWPAGSRIPSQRLLAQQYGVSRASLREAVMTLETLGLLHSEPGRGTFVTRPGSEARQLPQWRHHDMASPASVFETRVMLEPAIAAAAARQAAPMVAEDLCRLTDEMEAAWRSGDLIAHVEADRAFHANLAEHCGNPLLQTLYRSVRDMLQETQRIPIPVTPDARMAQSLNEHRRVAAAVATGDAATAYNEMSGHIIHTARCAGIALAAAPQVSAGAERPGHARQA